MTTKVETSRGVTPTGRVSYPHLFEAKLFKGKRNFSIVLIFDKDDPGLAAMKKIANEVAKAKWGDKLPRGFMSPFKDGDEKEKPEYAGKVFINFKAQESRRPGVVDQGKQPITAESGAFYAGCYARVSYNCYAYDVDGSVGVNFGLNNVQKVKDGDRFDGGTSAEDDFEALEDTSDSDLF
jgi:hypothetical protein